VSIETSGITLGVSASEDFQRALEVRRALLRARDSEIARAKELRATAALIASCSRNAIRRSQKLLEESDELRRRKRNDRSRPRAGLAKADHAA